MVRYLVLKENMKELKNINKRRNDLEEEISKTLDKITKIVSSSMSNLCKVKEIRKETYEDINQHQHEFLLLDIVEYLEQQHKNIDIYWEWNPHQTGGKHEPDLIGKSDDTIIFSIEATASENPIGAIDKRMKNTLSKFFTENFEGTFFYFVRTATMKNRAETKLSKMPKGSPVKVILL